MTDCERKWWEIGGQNFGVALFSSLVQLCNSNFPVSLNGMDNATSRRTSTSRTAPPGQNSNSPQSLMRRTTNLNTKEKMKNTKTATKKNASNESEFGRLTDFIREEGMNDNPDKAKIGAALKSARRLITQNTNDERTAKKTFLLWARGVLPGWSTRQVRSMLQNKFFFVHVGKSIGIAC